MATAQIDSRDTARKSACRELRNTIGATKVRDDEITRVTYSRIYHGFDAMMPFREPCFVVFPETREDVVETLKIANRYKVPVTPIGTTAIQMPTSEGGIILDQRRRNKILEINTDSGYAVVEAGVTFDQLTAAMRGTGFKCSVGTMPGTATVLGQAMSRGSQSFSTRHLSLVIDLEVVLPDGTVFNTGSSHFPGVGSHLQYGPFPDLSGLYTCGYGTMGVVTKGAIRIHPMNDVHKINYAGFDKYSDALDFCKELINNNIPEHTFIWDWHMYRSWPLAPEDMEKVMPAIRESNVLNPPEGTPFCLVTTLLSGFQDVVEVYEKVCERLAVKYHGQVLPQEEWERRFPESAPGFRQAYEEYSYREAVHWAQGRFTGFYVFAAPKDIKEVEEYAIRQLASFGTRINPVSFYSHPFDFGRSVLLRICGFPDPADTKTRLEMREKFAEMYATALNKYRAVPIAPVGMASKVGPFMDVLQRIKNALDPNNILSRDSAIGFSREEKQ
jgi:FAD/FMN-containing dehydrogenase